MKFQSSILRFLYNPCPHLQIHFILINFKLKKKKTRNVCVCVCVGGLTINMCTVLLFITNTYIWCTLRIDSNIICAHHPILHIRYRISNFK
ncbi:hypothetical protein Hanom_Chr02g00157931 [Helianthus anomalus]